MNILILGAGRVGESVAESLVSEQNDITVVDTDPARLALLQDRLDLRAWRATASSRRCCATRASRTPTCSSPARRWTRPTWWPARWRTLFNVPTTIARIRSPEFQDDSELTGTDTASRWTR
jgi:trk system potassium uptake protein TrkA